MERLEFRETNRGLRLFAGARALTAPDPTASAARRLGGVPVAPGRLFFLVSPVFPDAIEQFLDSLPGDCYVVALEAEPEAVHVDERWHRLEERSGFLTLFGHNLNAAAEWVDRLIEGSRLRSIQSVWMTSAAQRNRAYYDALLRRAEESLALAWQNRATLLSFGRLWLRNLFLNLSEIRYSLDDAVHLAARPIVVAGAGPSLEESVPWIIEERERISLLAVDTALPHLLARGVVPDAVISVDAQQLNVKDLIPPPPEGVELLYDVTAAPSFVRKFSRQRRFAFVSHFAEGSLWSLLSRAGIQIPEVEAGGSVGTTALLLAERLRRASGTEGYPVFLTGLDFTFPPGLPHARMTYTHILSLTAANRLAPEPFVPHHLARGRVPAPAKGGGTVETDYVLSGYAARLRAGAGRFRGFLDLSRRGVDIGFQRCTFDEAEAWLDRGGDKQRGAAPYGSQGQTRTALPASEEGRKRRAPRFSGDKVAAFLESEARELRRLAQLIREGERPWQELEGLLRERDYLYLYFPDPAPRKEASFLRRVVASISYFLRHGLPGGRG